MRGSGGEEERKSEKKKRDDEMEASDEGEEKTGAKGKVKTIKKERNCLK